MDSQNVGNKNPYNINIVKKKIKSALKKYENRYVIIKIPVVSEVLYGRKVGYKFRKEKLSKKIQKISASNIRKKLLNKWKKK